MRRDVSLVVALSMTALWHAGLAHAFTAPANDPAKAAVTDRVAAPAIGIRVVRPSLVGDSGKSAAVSAFRTRTGATVKADALSGAPRVLSGATLTSAPRLRSLTDAADYAAQALRFVDEHPELFNGISSKDLVLNTDATLLDKDLQLLKFGLAKDGLKVQDANVDFRFKRGKLVQVVNESFAEAQNDGRPGLAGLERSVERALNASRVTPTGERYRVRATKKGYELVRVAQFDAVTSADTYAVQVEAATGRIFEIRPRKFMLDGSATGQVHNRYYGEPLVMRPLSHLTLKYAGGSVTTDGQGLFRDAPENSQPAIEGLEGPRIRVTPETGAALAATGVPARDNWNVVYTKNGTEAANADKTVAQAMIFYHINKEVDVAKKYISNPWLDQQLQANANLSQTCNAYWDGSSINLFSAGGGCANTGLISDVLYHEWGHGLDANTGGIEDGAYSEGFGDAMSMVMTQSEILGIGFMDNGDPVRELETDKIYPQDGNTEVHAEGLIIASTYWDLFKALRDQYGATAASDKLANFALKGIIAASRYTDAYDALLVIDDDDTDPSNGTPNFCLVNKVFAQHGLATADEGCNLARLDTFEIDDQANGNGNGVLEPGETAKIFVTARNAASTDLPSLEGILSVSGAAGVSVRDGSLAWGPVAAHTAARSADAAEITVGSGVACGSSIHAKVNLTSGTRAAVSEQDLTVGSLDGVAQSFTVAGLPLPIKDNATATATFSVDGAQWAADTTVYGARLVFDITHSYAGDLTVSIVSPDGTAKDVWKGSGATDNAHFDQDVTALVKGLKGAGAWQVRVTDSATQDEGTLDSVSFTATPAHFTCQ